MTKLSMEVNAMQRVTKQHGRSRNVADLIALADEAWSAGIEHAKRGELRLADANFELSRMYREDAACMR